MKSFRDMINKRNIWESRENHGFVIPNKPTREEVWDFCEYVSEWLGEKDFLDALTRALSTYELLDNLKFIANEHDIPYSDEEDEDEEDEED